MLLYRPEVFQGNLGNKNYFEGWYFKNVSADLESVWSLIPGISLSKEGNHAFIQVIDGISCHTEYISYPIEQFTYDRKSLYVKIGDSVFTRDHASVNIDNEKIKARGQLSYKNQARYPKTLFSPGIMGWYSFVPYMECKHGVVSAHHTISGQLEVNNNVSDFEGGRGYIEKDWGTSFPEAWLWCQANNFSDRNCSLFVSVAKIPWLGSYFTGLIAFLYLKGKFHIFSTYNNSKVSILGRTDNEVSLQLKSRESTLKIRIRQNGSGRLKAPVSGRMTRIIKESIDSDVWVEMHNSSGELIFSDYSRRAGVEIIEKIFDYINLKS
jgi:tocopherol cyclase